MRVCVPRLQLEQHCCRAVGNAWFLFWAASRLATRRLGDWWPEVPMLLARLVPASTTGDLNGKIRDF